LKDKSVCLVIPDDDIRTILDQAEDFRRANQRFEVLEIVGKKLINNAVSSSVFRACPNYQQKDKISAFSAIFLTTVTFFRSPLQI